MFLGVSVTLGGMDEQGKTRAAKYVAGVMADLGRDESWLVSMTGLDKQTVRTFLLGETWPRNAKRQAIEGALQLAFGTIERAALGFVQVEPPGDPVERAIQASGLSRGNKHTLVGLYYDMLDKQNGRGTG